MDFDEFSVMVRAREMGIHTEAALRQRFEELDADGSGYVEMTEFIKFALRDALSRSVIKVADLLESWDTDGDDEVDVYEFRRAVRHLGFSGLNEEIDAVFNEMDRDGSGTLSVREIELKLEGGAQPRGMKQQSLRDMSWRANNVDETQLAAAARDASRSISLPHGVLADSEAAQEVRAVALLTFLSKNIRNVMHLFRKWDTDADGVLTQEEFTRAVEVLEFELQPGDLEVLWAMLDKDESGCIDYCELSKTIHDGPDQLSSVKSSSRGGRRIDTPRASSKGKDMVRTKQSRVLHRAKLDLNSEITSQLAAALAAIKGKATQLFHEWDVNHDGTLSAREFKQALAPFGLPSAVSDAIDQVFEFVDRDGNGTVSLEEFMKAIRPSGAQRTTQNVFGKSSVSPSRPKLPALSQTPRLPYVRPMATPRRQLELSGWQARPYPAVRKEADWYAEWLVEQTILHTPRIY